MKMEEMTDLLLKLRELMFARKSDQNMRTIGGRIAEEGSAI